MSSRKVKVNDEVGHGDVLVSTEAVVDTFSIDYEVKNFPNFDTPIDSPIFVGGPKSKHVWKLQVDPNTKIDGEDAEYVGILLLLVKKSGDPKTTVPAEFQIYLINSKRKVYFAQNCFYNFPTLAEGFGWKILKSDVLDPNNGYLTDSHTLKIHCKVSLTLEPTSSKFPNISSNSDLQSTFEQFSEKMSSFLDGGKFADFIIQTNTSSFPVCKVLLAGRSDVFDSMFNSGMQESRENLIKIQDHSDEAVKGMLKFIYTGKIDLAETNAEDLLAISDKYQVLDMKLKCEEFLLKNLKIDNAADTLIMAHFHSPTSLKPKVISFVNRYKKEVQLTDGFKEMEKTHPIIFADLYKSID